MQNKKVKIESLNYLIKYALQMNAINNIHSNGSIVFEVCLGYAVDKNVTFLF